MMPYNQKKCDLKLLKRTPSSLEENPWNESEFPLYLSMLQTVPLREGELIISLLKKRPGLLILSFCCLGNDLLAASLRD